MTGLFESEDPQPKKVVDRLLKRAPTKDDLLANMVNRSAGADFLSVDIKKSKPKAQDKGVIEPPIDYISDD